VTGTIQQNRKGLPHTLTKKKLKIKKHEVAAYRKHDKMLALAWKDKRNVVTPTHETTHIFHVMGNDFGCQNDGME